MNALMSLKFAGISILLVAMLAACDKPGPMETAGKKLDQTVDKAGNKIDDAADQARDKINEKIKQTGSGAAG